MEFCLSTAVAREREGERVSGVLSGRLIWLGLRQGGGLLAMVSEFKKVPCSSVCLYVSVCVCACVGFQFEYFYKFNIHVFKGAQLKHGVKVCSRILLAR